MHNLINRLDAICHPFPGTHVLGVVGSLLLIGSLIILPAVGETDVRPDKMTPIPELSWAITERAAPTKGFDVRTER